MSSPVGGSGVQPVSGILPDGTAALAHADHEASPSTNGPDSPTAQRALSAGQSIKPRDVLQASGASETIRWVRRAVAVAVPIVALSSIFTAYADLMPASHHVPTLVAAPIFVAAWMIELSGVRWPRLALIAAIVLPNLWLTLIGHTETNLLFLPLVVGWVAFVGTRAEGLLALVLAFATICVAALFIVAPNIGAIPWENWTEWSFSLILTWFLCYSLRKQERLVIDLDDRSHELERRSQELEQRSQELELLLTACRSVASTLEMRQLLDTLFDALSRVLDDSSIAVLTLDDTRDALTVAAGGDQLLYTSQEFQRIRYSVADLGPIWDRLREEEPIVIPDVRGGSREASVFRGLIGDQLLDASDTFLRSLMWVPWVVRGQITGVLTITSASPAVFGIRETTLALGIARQAAVAIDNARLLQRARQVAILEEASGCPASCMTPSRRRYTAFRCTPKPPVVRSQVATRGPRCDELARDPRDDTRGAGRDAALTLRAAPTAASGVRLGGGIACPAPGRRSTCGPGDGVRLRARRAPVARQRTGVVSAGSGGTQQHLEARACRPRGCPVGRRERRGNPGSRRRWC